MPKTVQPRPVVGSPPLLQQQRLMPLLLLLVIAVGLGLRWVNLAHSVYWGDEVYSSIRIFGHRTTELRQAIAQGNYVTAEFIQSFQHLSPSKGWSDTLLSLAIEDAHLTPLYFLLVRLWTTWFGDSVAVIRSFSALCGCLLLPVMFGLALELFERRRTALYVAALVAIAPIHQIYAQEARLYSLWTLTVAIAAWMLLRALRQRDFTNWGRFTIALTISLYSHLLSVIILGGFCLYVVSVYWRDRRQLLAFASAAGISLLMLGPWLWVFLNRKIVDNYDQAAYSGPIDLILMLKNWFSNFRRGFIDFNTSLRDTPSQALLLITISGLCLLVLLLAFSLLRRSTPPRTWLFVVMLITTLPVALFDDSLSGLLPPRWILPSYLGLQLLLGYFFSATNWTQAQGTIWRRRPAAWNHSITQRWLVTVKRGLRRSGVSSFRQLKRLTFAILLIVGLTSCVRIVQSEAWWHRGMSECNPQAAQVIAQAPNSLVLSDGLGGLFFDHALSNVISLTHLVPPETLFQIVLEPQTPKLDLPRFSHIWVLTPSQHLRDWLNERYPGQLQQALRFHRPYRPYRGSEICLWQLSASSPVVNTVKNSASRYNS